MTPEEAYRYMLALSRLAWLLANANLDSRYNNPPDLIDRIALARQANGEDDKGLDARFKRELEFATNPQS